MNDKEIIKQLQEEIKYLKERIKELELVEEEPSTIKDSGKSLIKDEFVMKKTKEGWIKEQI